MGRPALRLPILALLTASATASAAPQPFGLLWEKGHASILVTHCRTEIGIDPLCHGMELQQGGTITRLGRGYLQTKVLWKRPPGGTGPDVLVLGDNGGSGGLGDLFAVTLAPMSIQKLSGERMTETEVDRSAASLPLKLNFDIEYFNGASHAQATIVRIPTIWRHGNFAVDLPALTSRDFSKDEIDFRVLAVASELDRWADARYPADVLYPPDFASNGTPVTVQALADLILAGHAFQAREVLSRAWPHSHERTDLRMGGEQLFWQALCRAIVRHPLWQHFGLDRLPEAGIVKAAAAAAT